MNRKKIFILIIIIFILLTILASAVIYLNSKSYLKVFLENGNRNVNYSKAIDNGNEYVKGYIQKVVYNNGDIMYYDYENEEGINIVSEDKKIYLFKIIKEESSNLSKYKTLEDSEFEYKKNEIVNGIECKVIDLYSKEAKNIKQEKKNEEYIIDRIWINKKNGIVVKKAYYKVNNQIENKIFEEEYNMNTGKVTDQDILKPNLEEYNEYEIIDNRHLDPRVERYKLY